VELPTALGFCMAIKRACLEEVGSFDRETFGRGYGEENDFSLRAIAANWRHVAAPSVFVWHRGGASFGSERNSLIEVAQQTLERMHPGYAAAVQRFIRMDPLRPIREALDVARIRDDPRRKALWTGRQFPTSNSDTLILALRSEIAPFAGQYRVVAADFPPVPNLKRIQVSTPIGDLARMMQALDVEEVRTPGSSCSAMSRHVRKAARAAGIASA
jgi:hypothetical protein